MNADSPLKIGIAGCTGRVGSLLVQELQSGPWEGVALSGGTTQKQTDLPFFTTNDMQALMDQSDCIIDFTVPEATEKHVALAVKNHKPIIIGTTGLSAEQEKNLAESAKETTIVYAANMSVGVNILLELVKQAASKLDLSWDIEIFESHHKNKIDAPSGTALALGHAAAQGRKKNPGSQTSNTLYNISQKEGDAHVFDRNGERLNGEIGYAVSRGGDVVGEHNVTFYGMGERLELGHRASDRSLFAKGAIRAALWASHKTSGLYSMRDVLGFE